LPRMQGQPAREQTRLSRMTRTTTRVRGHPVAVLAESCSRCGEMRSAAWCGDRGWNEATLHAYRSDEHVLRILGFVVTERGVECPKCIEATNEGLSR